MLPADVVGRKLLVAPTPDLVGVGSSKHFNDVVKADVEVALFANAINAGQKLLGRDRAIESCARRKAVIASVAAFLGKVFTKISQQLRAPAGGRFGIVHH